MRQIYKIHNKHKKRIKYLFGDFSDLGLKKYNGPDPNENYEDLVYDWYDDWYCMVVIEDLKKFNYSLIKHPDLHKFLHKTD